LTNTNGMSPFFSGRDNDILSGESTRDPLGLLPIWSTVGHGLIPGLASIVTQIDGVQGILFLYTCLDELKAKVDSGAGKYSFRENLVLQFLERLWEYHLFDETGKPCFGITSLSGADFQLTTARAGVVGTGLRQYYRGTCKNKGILSDNLKTLTAPYKTLTKGLSTEKVVNWMVARESELLQSNYSVSAAEVYKELGEELKEFSKGTEQLWEKLQSSLVDDHGKKVWLDQLITDNKNFAEVPVPQLVAQVQTYANKNQNDELSRKCQRILDCEPFLQVLESVFLIVQQHGRSALSAIVQNMKENPPKDLSHVCLSFQNISSSSKRLTHLKELALKLYQGQYEEFLREFLNVYYATLCNERGRSPIVYLDGNDILALKPNDVSVKWSACTSNWGNGYFIKTQLKLYQDLIKRLEALNG